VLRNRHAPELSEANSNARPSRPKQLLKKPPNDVSIILFTDENMFTVATPNKSSAVAEMGDRLATIDMAENGGGLLCPFPWGELGPHLAQCRLNRGLPPYQVAS